MKILQIYKDYYPPVVGGIETHINCLSQGLKKSNHDVTVLVSNTDSTYKETTIDGIKIIKAPEIGRYASAPITLTLPFLIKQIGDDADILHFHLPNPTFVLAFLNSGLDKPCIVTYHSDIVRQIIPYQFYKPFQKVFLNRADAIIATSSQYIKTSSVLKRYKKKCSVIPIGIDTNRFQKPNKRAVDRIKDEYGNRIILFIGCLRYYKGLNVLIESFKKIDAKLIIIGNGPLKIELEKIIRQESLSHKIFMLGKLNDKNLCNFLHACNAFVLPSTLRSEAYGIVLLEAMACGKPIICTELGTGTTFINQHLQTGIVVPPNNPHLLAQAINSLLNNSELSKRLGNAAHYRACNIFNSEEMLKKTSELYLQVAAKFKSKKVQLFNTHTIFKIARKYHQLSKNQSVFQKKESKVNQRLKKIKVLRIVSRLNTGGPSIHCSILTNALNNERFSSKLVQGTISKHEGDMSYLMKNEGIVYKVPELQREINLSKDIIAFFKIAHILIKEKPDVVHTHLAKAGAVSRFAVFILNLIFNKKIKTVHTFHGHVLEGYFSPIKSNLILFIERNLAKCTSAIIAISQTQKNELSKKYRIADNEKIHLINLGLNLKHFVEPNKNEAFKASLKISNDTILIGIIGRLTPIKNHTLFLDTAKIIRDTLCNKSFKFLIVGDGELRQNLEQYATRIGILSSVIFYGWERDIRKVYSGLDILLLTSNNEGTPVSIIEAMASSVPVITTDVGGVKDLLGKINVKNYDGACKICERGILCPKQNSIEIANAVRYLIENENHDRIKNARDFVLVNYSDKLLIKRIEDLYQKLLTRPLNTQTATWWT